MTITINPKIQFPELKFGKHQTPFLKQIGCPIDHMPYMMQPLDPQKGVWIPWAHQNAFQPKSKWNPQMPAMFDGLVGMPQWKVLVRVFGWVEKMKRLAIGNFVPQVHVLDDDRIVDEQIKAGKMTTMMASDPEVHRSHAMLWRGVNAEGIEYVIDESPRVDEGEWVNTSGERGEGQHVYAGVGSNWYKRYVRQRERELGIEPIMRIGDPRGFATESGTETGTRSMFELFNSDGAENEPDEAAMFFMAAKVKRTALLDLENVVTLLAFDLDKFISEGSLSVENRPKLFIATRCKNLIRCMMNFQVPESGRVSDDDKNPYKDFIDALRYVFSVPLEYFDASVQQGRKGGGFG